MKSNNAAYNQKEIDRRLDAVKLCGVNRGRHDYIPISWETNDNTQYVSVLMCVVCFSRVKIKTLIDNFPEVSI